ncbi:MAG: nitrilase, partial [Deltaproteobacteria bacterium]|nr:nitrilase [Deltaproteobacteria bacterium]
DIPANVDKACRLVNKARQRVDLLVFPELALTGYAVGNRFHELALRIDSPLFQRLVESTSGITVAIGFVEETDSFHFFNSLAFIKDRQLLQTHRKIYLPNYGVFEERKYFSAGRNFDPVDLGRFRLAPFICGDAWNPASVHLAASDQAHIILISACSPDEALGSRLSTRENWKRLNRFYASIFGCYVVFVNRTGSENQLQFWGGSEIIDPFGQAVTSSGGDGEELVFGEAHLSQVREARTVLYTLRDDDLNFLQRRLAKIIDRHYL